MKKTPWFPGDVKPVRDGVYDRRMSWGVCYAKFSRGRWFSSGPSKYLARDEPMQSGVQEEVPWRGLAQDPEGVTK